MFLDPYILSWYSIQIFLPRAKQEFFLQQISVICILSIPRVPEGVCTIRVVVDKQEFIACDVLL